MKKFLSAILLSFAIVGTTQAMGMGGHGSDDPLRNLDYASAFDPKRFEKFRGLMGHWECTDNVFTPEYCDTEPVETAESTESLHIPPTDLTDAETPLLESEVAPDDHTYAAQEQELRKKSLAQLAWARRRAILKPAGEAATTCCCLSVGTAAAWFWMPGGTYAAGFGLLNAPLYLREVARSCLNLFSQPSSALDSLEKRYALKQCFIPRQLWPIIRDKFTMARMNQFEQQRSIDFIEFALGLTCYKPQKAIDRRIDPATVKDQIAAKIDAFFKDYTGAPDLAQLKANIDLFIDNFLGIGTKAPRPQFLFGLAGAGKNQFAAKLNKWLNEVLSDGVHFESAVVDSPAELEGDAQHYGVFLRVLRNQLQEGKRGSILFLDEAGWLSKGPDDPWTHCAKRVFNGTMATISTSYFGAGIQGTGLSLAMPPMLIFVASNAEIKEDALKTRFDPFMFPTPKKEALVKYALELFEKSTTQYAQAQAQDEVARIQEAIRDELSQPHVNLTRMLAEDPSGCFRYIERFIEPFVYRQRHDSEALARLSSDI